MRRIWTKKLIKISATVLFLLNVFVYSQFNFGVFLLDFIFLLIFSFSFIGIFLYDILFRQSRLVQFKVEVCPIQRLLAANLYYIAEKFLEILSSLGTHFIINGS